MKQTSSNNTPKNQSRLRNPQMRNTIILISVILLLALVCFLVKTLFFGKVGATAIVSQNGTVIYELPLSKPTEITLDDGCDGTNTIVVKDHAIYMSESNCPDLICVYTGAISNTGEIIACLPHGLIITITE